MFGLVHNNRLRPIVNLIQDLAFAVFTGYVVSLLINKDAELVFADNLIIRKRTSENSNNRISLCILVGNKTNNEMYDITCQLIYSYINDLGERCSDIQLKKDSHFIDNYYRFSFAYDEFPKILWKRYLYKRDLNEDYLIVIIKGTYCDLGGTFYSKKRYFLQDVIIGENAKAEDFNVIKKYNKKKTFDWKAFKKCYKTEKDDTNKRIIQELTKFVES